MSWAICIATLGCDKSDSTATTPPPGSDAYAGVDPTGPHAAGKRVFNSQGCTCCHSIGEESGGKGKKRIGPDLAHVAADSTHTSEWIADYIRDPKSKTPNSRMPAFQGKIADEDFKNLVEFLASLK
jgi:cbb3-type cytochrome oxidase cytochrome c subunit